METLLHTVPAHNSNQLSRAEDQANEIPAEIPAVTNTCQFDSFSGNCFLWRIKVGVSARVCTFLFCVCVCGRVRFIPTGREALACGWTSHWQLVLTWTMPQGSTPLQTHTHNDREEHTHREKQGIRYYQNFTAPAIQSKHTPSSSQRKHTRKGIHW